MFTQQRSSPQSSGGFICFSVLYVMSHSGSSVSGSSPCLWKVSLSLEGLCIWNVSVSGRSLSLEGLWVSGGLGLSGAGFLCLRQNGIGMGSTCARVGGVLAPVVLLQQAYHVHTPMIVFGLGCVIGSALTLLLPETANQPLPETIEDVEEDSPPR